MIKLFWDKALQQILTATAINLVRLVDWFDDPVHHAPKPSPFSAVMATAS
jgi:hypothetical protein